MMRIKYYEIGKWFQTHHDASLFLLCSAKLDYPNRLLNFQGFGKLLKLLANISQFALQTAYVTLQCGIVKTSVVKCSVMILHCSDIAVQCSLLQLFIEVVDSLAVPYEEWPQPWFKSKIWNGEIPVARIPEILECPEICWCETFWWQPRFPE